MKSKYAGVKRILKAFTSSFNGFVNAFLIWGAYVYAAFAHV